MFAWVLCLPLLNAAAQEAEQQPSPAPVVKPIKTRADTMNVAAAASDAEMREKFKAAGSNVSLPAIEIVKMSEAGADSAVIQSYVENLTIPYSLRAEDVIYLHDHGITTPVITALIQRGTKLREQQAATAQANAAAQAAQQAPPANAGSYAPAPVAPTYAASPAYVYPTYTYPSYAYDYGYWPYYSGVGFYFAGYPYCYGRSYYGGHYYGGHYGGHYGGYYGGAHYSGGGHYTSAWNSSHAGGHSGGLHFSGSRR